MVEWRLQCDEISFRLSLGAELVHHCKLLRNPSVLPSLDYFGHLIFCVGLTGMKREIKTEDGSVQGAFHLDIVCNVQREICRAILETQKMITMNGTRRRTL